MGENIPAENAPSAEITLALIKHPLFHSNLPNLPNSLEAISEGGSSFSNLALVLYRPRHEFSGNIRTPRIDILEGVNCGLIGSLLDRYRSLNFNHRILELGSVDPAPRRIQLAGLPTVEDLSDFPGSETLKKRLQSEAIVKAWAIANDENWASVNVYLADPRKAENFDQALVNQAEARVSIVINDEPWGVDNNIAHTVFQEYVDNTQDIDSETGRGRRIVPLDLSVDLSEKTKTLVATNLRFAYREERRTEIGYTQAIDLPPGTERDLVAAGEGVEHNNIRRFNAMYLRREIDDFNRYHDEREAAQARRAEPNAANRWQSTPRHTHRRSNRTHQPSRHSPQASHQNRGPNMPNVGPDVVWTEIDRLRGGLRNTDAELTYLSSDPNTFQTPAQFERLNVLCAQRANYADRIADSTAIDLLLAVQNRLSELERQRLSSEQNSRQARDVGNIQQFQNFIHQSQIYRAEMLKIGLNYHSEVESAIFWNESRFLQLHSVASQSGRFNLALLEELESGRFSRLPTLTLLLSN